MRHLYFKLITALLLYSLAPSIRSENIIYQWLEHNKTFFSDRAHANAQILKFPEYSSRFKVKRIIDGDTVLLENDVRVRLLGINTPEISHQQRQEESGGNIAKQWLASHLHHQKVRLETDTERYDKYGRTLAYLFTPTNVNINEQLVAEGFATVSLYPPNLKYADILIKAQTEAELKHKGIWGDPNYRLKTLQQLNQDNPQGWQRISGIVQRVYKTRQYFYLEFSEHFNVRIHRSNAYLFPDFNTYLNQPVEVRGWINHQKNQLSMLIRHPDSIRQ